MAVVTLLAHGGCAASSFLVLSTTPASAAATHQLSWSVSNNQVSATGVTYSYSFTAATTGTIKSITFVVSGAGLAGTPAIAKNFGIGAGSVGISGQTITYTVTSAVSVTAGIPIYLEFSGLTNSSTTGSYTTVITTRPRHRRRSTPRRLRRSTSPRTTPP